MHAPAWGISLAAAALMGALPGPRPGGADRLGAAAAWSWAVVLLALGINIATSFQWLQSARTAAVWTSYVLVFITCTRLAAGGARAGSAPIKGRDRWQAAGAPVMTALIVAGSGLAAHGLYQALYSFSQLAAATGPELPGAVRARLESGRAVSTLGLPGALAGYLIISLPVTLAWAWAGKPGRGRRWIGCGLAALQVAGLAATRSAAGVISLALAGAIAAWWGGGEAAGFGRRRRVAVALMAVGLAGAAALSAIRLAGPAAGEEPGPFALRAGNWKVAAEILSAHPLFGAGTGCYGIAFPAHRTWEMNESRFAHNSYLQIASECGIFLGALPPVLAALLAVKLLRRARSGGSVVVAPLLAAACLAFLLHNLVDFTFYVPTVAYAFFCAAGLAVGARAGADRPAAPAWLHGPEELGKRIALASASLLLALFALPVTRADMAREVARDQILAGRDGPALAQARLAVSLNPLDPDARSLLSHMLLREAQRGSDEALLIQAEETARLAVDLDPRTPHHWHHLGRMRLARSDPQGAFIALQRATELYPIKIEYRQDRDAVALSLAPHAGAPGAAR